MEFSLALRVPGWCSKATVKVNGKPAQPVMRKGYAYIKRTWKNNDIIHLSLPMAVERLEAHPSVRQNTGRVALQRGPIVYCLEETDNGKDLHDIALDPKPRFTIKKDKELGVPVITTRGRKRKQENWEHCLYNSDASETQSCIIKAIPYYLWSNRGTGEMLVWIRQK
jgi:DUF1680 family protein